MLLSSPNSVDRDRPIVPLLGRKGNCARRSSSNVACDTLRTMTLTLVVLLPFAGALIAAFLPSHARNAAGWLSGLVTLACTTLVVSLYSNVNGAEAVLRERVGWAPRLGLELYLRMDGYAWLFALLVSFMGVLVVLYARYYMSPQDPVPRFFSFLMAFMGAMLGIVLSGNLIQLVVFWELTSLTSFMLIAYWYHRADARRGARMALIVTATGGMCLLLGVVLAGQHRGQLRSRRRARCGRRDSQRMSTIRSCSSLILLGALTKSAQFPFHFWLPHAMAAPTPVSAYLHSATMVKAGVFLLARLWPVLAGTDPMVLDRLRRGVLLASVRRCCRDLSARPQGSARVFDDQPPGTHHTAARHEQPARPGRGRFPHDESRDLQGSLFMAAGIVDHETGTRDMRRLSGLSHAMPVTATVALVAAAAMAGVPLLNGFLSKEMFFAETIFAGRGAAHSDRVARCRHACEHVQRRVLRALHSQRLLRTAAARFAAAPHEPTRGMLAPSALLVLACVLVGIFPEQTIGPSLRLAVRSILGAETPSSA